MFGLFNKLAQLRQILGVVRTSYRGVAKRIDENRELLDLLQQEAPEILKSKPCIVGWLEGQDGFLTELAQACGDANSLGFRSDAARPYPRKWSLGCEAQDNVESNARLPEDKRSKSIDPVAIPAHFIRYFVSYSYFSAYGSGGYGCIEIGRSQTIRSQQDIIGIIDLIADGLKAKNLTNPNVVVLNWQQFEPPRQDDGGREVVEDGVSSTVVLRLVA